MRAIAIDFETANERRTSPCAVGLAWIEDGIVIRRAYRLVRPPEMRFAPGNVRVHGIRPADVTDAPELPEAMAEFLPELASTPLLAHNAGFDVAVLRDTLNLYGAAVPRLSYFCTRAIARAAWPEQRSVGLAAMASLIGLVFRHHHAGEDAFACARVALAAAERVGTGRISIMAERLAVRAGSADARGHVPCLAGRAAEGEPRRNSRPIVVRPLRAPEPTLTFKVRGSQGALHEIGGSFTRRGYTLRCTCTAGVRGRLCRHVTSLLDGEVTDLVSDNLFDLEKLRTIIEALGPETLEPRAKIRPPSRCPPDQPTGVVAAASHMPVA